jgi:phosphatidylglycerol lysyltransferase
VFLVYSLIRPYFFRPVPSPEEIENARDLLTRFGKSSLDYFKLYYDKQIYILPEINSFISYKIQNNFAVVLEDPVTPGEDEKKRIIKEFSGFCYDNSLKEIYYRISSESLPVYLEAGKKSFFIGQEGVVDLQKFTLEGGEKKSIRNALNKLKDQGYVSQVYTPPLRDGLIQKLRSVSDDWLKSMDREEIVFSQGMFREDELKNQTVIAVENREEKIIAFLNIIPDYKPDEGTYDLLRKTHDAPNGVMDFILVELFRYFSSRSVRYVNLGLAPLSGLDDPHKFPEKTLKFAYEKIRSFSHYRGQKEYKDKFDPVWYDRFLVYDNDYDLISIPAVLAKVIRS